MPPPTASKPAPRPILRYQRRAITAIAAATLAGAWFFELVLDIRPCPLCPSSVTPIIWRCHSVRSRAFAAAKDVSRAGLLIGLAMLALAALANAGLGVYHAGVEWKFWQGPTECTGTVGNLGSAGSLLQRSTP